MRFYFHLSLVILIYFPLSLQNGILRNYKDFNPLLWSTYKRSFNKQYSDNEISYKRSLIFKENVENIIMFNLEKKKSYKIGITQFTDMSIEELAEKYLDMNLKHKIGLQFLKMNTNYEQDKKYDYPSIDWRAENIFLEPRDQGECGGCWAFSSVGVIEGLRAKQYGIKKYLSPQQLIDCDTKEKGCKGGWPSIAYNYAANNGLVSEDDYQYKAENGVCNDQIVASHTEVKISKTVKSCEEEECMQNDFQYNLLKDGPIAVVIDAYNTNFFNYKSGIYDESCGEPNHAVILVGFGIDDETQIQYWIIRNSWNTTWGMNGYGYVKFDLNNLYSCNLNRYGYQPKLIN